MQDDTLPPQMTADDIVTAMLNAQRETTTQIATLQCEQAQQQQQFTQMLQTLTSAIQNQPTPTIALATPLVNPSANTQSHAASPAPKIPLPDTYDGARQGSESFLSGLQWVKKLPQCLLILERLAW